MRNALSDICATRFSISLIVSANVSDPRLEFDIGNSELEDGLRLVKAESHSLEDFRLSES